MSRPGDVFGEVSVEFLLTANSPHHFACIMLVNHRENSILDQECIPWTYFIYLLNIGIFVKISMGYFLIVHKTSVHLNCKLQQFY